MKVICSCGSEIVSLDYWNKCNDQGEECYEGVAECSCGKYWLWDGWGECEGLEQAKSDLQEYINENK